MTSALFPETKPNRKTASEIVALYLHGASKR